MLPVVSPTILQPRALPMRLSPSDTSAKPKLPGAWQSGCGGVPAKSTFPAMIVFRSVNDDEKLLTPPPVPAPAVPLVLFVMVTLFRSATPFCQLVIPAPLLPLSLPLMVELTSVNVPSFQIPPPCAVDALWLPAIVLPVTVAVPPP